MKLGAVAIARTTFDIPYAADHAAAALQTLRSGEEDVLGSADLRTDEDAVRAAVDELLGAGVDAIVVVQATFADSSLAVAAADHDLPVVLWAFSEPRTGGRLRLNSFCGINLAGFTLTNGGRAYSWVVVQPEDPSAVAAITAALERSPARPSHTSPQIVSDDAHHAAVNVVERLRSTTIGRVGERPDGFEPCGYVPDVLSDVVGVTVDEVPLPELFARAGAAPADAVASARSRASAFLAGVDDVDQDALDHSLRLNAGLKDLIDDRGWAGVATRCWPETFTEFGGAACTPMAMLTEDGTPGSCEADIYGNITGLLMSWLAGSASFVADLVDVDRASNTGVFWHCGLAPFEMADPEATPVATIHSNRKKPLLSEFPLKPGRVTLARLSQSSGRTRLLIAGAEMLREPLPFSGTAGVARFDASVDDVIATIMDEGLEHHYGIVYGDIRDELHGAAAELGIDVIEFTR